MDHLVTRRLVFLVSLGMAALMSGHAETLLDPTRPASAQLDAASDSGPAAVITYQLQSVLIGRGAGGRRIAVINGQTMRVGDHLSDHAGAVAMVLIKISDGAVLIRSGARLQTLSLFPVPVKHPGATLDVEHEE